MSRGVKTVKIDIVPVTTPDIVSSSTKAKNLPQNLSENGAEPIVVPPY